MAMPELTRIYDRAFFQTWGRTHEQYVESARTIVDELVAQFRPGRLIDLGCGCGVYGHFFRAHGVDVVAVDGVHPPTEFSFDLPIELRDLTEPILDDWGRFDLTLCLDVAEHIPENLVDPFLENATRFAPLLLMACAPPGQGGHHHVNEQPKRYWIAQLARFGFKYNRKRTGVLCERFKQIRPAYMWMWEHISVYERQPEVSK